MEIKQLDVQSYYYGALKNAEEGEKHIKSLPCLSVVQATHGRYDFGLSPEDEHALAEGDVFVAPSDRMQYITHHVSPSDGKMNAHWLFLEAEINRRYSIEEVFSFPLVLPREYNKKLEQELYFVGKEEETVHCLPHIYAILEILLSCAQPITDSRRGMTAVKQLLLTQEKASADELARAANMSTATLYRKFRQEYGTSPAAFGLQHRLKRAAFLLETTCLPVTQIALETGFFDQAHLSRLFHRCFQCSPTAYRARFREKKDL